MQVEQVATISPEEQYLEALTKAQKRIYTARAELDLAQAALASVIRRMNADKRRQAVDPRSLPGGTWGT